MLTDDFSRVKLEVIDNDPNTDYINASFIKVSKLGNYKFDIHYNI